MRDFAIKYLIVFLCICLATRLMCNIFARPLTGIDDANIFLVYAKDFANGYGFVYNVGGERVEGFSSLLWVFMCALIIKITTKPELILIIIDIFLIALGATAALSYLQKSLLDRDNNRYKRSVWSTIFIVLYAVVFKDVPSNCTVVRVPAYIVRGDGKKVKKPL